MRRAHRDKPGSDRQRKRTEAERRDGEHQPEVDQLSFEERARLLHIPNLVERGTQRGHHPARRVDQADDGDQTEPGCAARRAEQQLPDVPGAARRQWQIPDDRVDDVGARAGGVQDQAAGAGEHDRQREQREQHVIRDRRGMLRAAVPGELRQRPLQQPHREITPANMRPHPRARYPNARGAPAQGVELLLVGHGPAVRAPGGAIEQAIARAGGSPAPATARDLGATTTARRIR